MSRKHEASYVIEGSDSVYKVDVSKRGGGTVGHGYEGFWDAEVSDMETGKPAWWTGTIDHDRIHTATARTHVAVAAMAVKYAEENR